MIALTSASCFQLILCRPFKRFGMGQNQGGCKEHLAEGVVTNQPVINETTEGLFPEPYVNFIRQTNEVVVV